MGPRTVFVDGYNVIRNTPALALVERVNMAAGRDALLTRLVARFRHTPHSLVVVFDGDGIGETSQPVAGFARGRVIFSRRDETADSVIIRMIADVCDAGREAMVYTNDREVLHGAERHGAAPARVDELRSGMEGGPRLLRKRFSHQQAVRREWEDVDPDARAAERKKGNGRRAPRKRGRDQ